jgi:hypothetical protein
MRFPWVSRGRFDDLEKRCEQLEAERRSLLDRVLELSSQKPLYAPAPTSVDQQAPSSTKDDKPEEPVNPPGRITIASVRNMANTRAVKAAHGGPALWSPAPKVANGS